MLSGIDEFAFPLTPYLALVMCRLPRQTNQNFLIQFDSIQPVLHRCRGR